MFILFYVICRRIYAFMSPPSRISHTVQWSIFKGLFQSKKIDLYFLMQPGLDKNIFFVMEFGQNPPVTTAIYLWKFENSSSQLNLLSECLQSITELDEKRTCVLYKRKKWINFLCLFTHFRPIDQWDTFFWYFLTLP